MVGKTPRWESELWSYVSKGDGVHCSVYSRCRARQLGRWCADDNMEGIKRLLEDRRFKLSDYDIIKPGRVCRMFQLVERLAQEWLTRAAVYCPPVPTELFSLSDTHHPIEVHLLPLKVYHGAIWRLREGWVIQLKDDDTSARKRFTLLHEAFHILAHCKTVPVFRKQGTVRGSFNELAAEYFAACILMPREWVKEKWAGVHDLNRMAEIFNVPKPTMCIRLKRMGLI